MKKNRKNRNRAGFSLAETLIAVLILLMVSAIVAAGMPMARTAYEDAVDAANAQTLLSTTVTMLRGELSEAKFLSYTYGTETARDTATMPIVYRSGRTGATTRLTTTPNGLTVEDYLDVDSRPQKAKHLLLTTETATKRLHTSYSNIEYNADTGIFIVSDLCVIKNGKAIATLETYEIRTVNS